MSELLSAVATLLIAAVLAILVRRAVVWTARRDGRINEKQYWLISSAVVALGVMATWLYFANTSSLSDAGATFFAAGAAALLVGGASCLLTRPIAVASVKRHSISE